MQIAEGVPGIEIPKEPVFEIYEQNLEAVELFLTFSQRWQHCPMSGRLIGLDWNNIQSILSLKKIDTNQQLIESIELIENGVLAQVSEDSANK